MNNSVAKVLKKKAYNAIWRALKVYNSWLQGGPNYFFYFFKKMHIYIFHKCRCQSVLVSSYPRDNHSYDLFVVAQWLSFLQHKMKWIIQSILQTDYFYIHGFLLKQGKKIITQKRFHSHLGNQKQSAIFKYEKNHEHMKIKK